MAFLDNISYSSIILALSYLLLSIYTFRRLAWLQSHAPKGLSTSKLFVVTLLLVSSLRFMSFLSLFLLNWADKLNDFTISNAFFGNISVFKNYITTLLPYLSSSNSNSRSSYDGLSSFFEKSLVVLFDFPDFSVHSAYFLLFIVWCDAFLTSRRHWLSSLNLRRIWMLTYFIFNILLYSTQIILYSLLFIDSITSILQIEFLYYTSAFFSFFLPIFWLSFYLYLSLLFSGFPYASLEKKNRLEYLNNLSLIWSFARLCWGFVALTSVLKGWLMKLEEYNTFVYSIFLVLIFFFTEILPILFSLQIFLLKSISEINHEANSSSSSPYYYSSVPTIKSNFTPNLDHSYGSINNLNYSSPFPNKNKFSKNSGYSDELIDTVEVHRGSLYHLTASPFGIDNKMIYDSSSIINSNYFNNESSLQGVNLFSNDNEFDDSDKDSYLTASSGED